MTSFSSGRRRLARVVPTVVLAIGAVGTQTAYGDELTPYQRHLAALAAEGADLSAHQLHLLRVWHLQHLKATGVELTSDQQETLRVYYQEEAAKKQRAAGAAERAAEAEAQRAHEIAENRDQMAKAGKYAVQTSSRVPLLVHAGPSTDATEVGSIASGQFVQVICQVPDGGIIEDDGSTVWAKIGEAPDRYVAAAPYLSRWSTDPTTEVCSDDEWTAQEAKEQAAIDTVAEAAAIEAVAPEPVACPNFARNYRIQLTIGVAAGLGHVTFEGNYWTALPCSDGRGAHEGLSWLNESHYGTVGTLKCFVDGPVEVNSCYTGFEHGALQVRADVTVAIGAWPFQVEWKYEVVMQMDSNEPGVSNTTVNGEWAAWSHGSVLQEHPIDPASP